MPTPKNGKVSINLKLSEEMYNRWVEIALKMKIMNMSEFIRSMVEEGIKNGSGNWFNR